LGFRTEITLEEGIRELYEWIKSNHTIDLSAAPQFNNQAMIREFAQSASRAAVHAAHAAKPGRMHLKLIVVHATGRSGSGSLCKLCLN